MLQNSFQEQLEDCPVIAAARDREGLARCCQSESGIVFILFGDVCTISEIVDHVKSAGKLAFVHMDLVNGLSSDCKLIHVDFRSRRTVRVYVSAVLFLLLGVKTLMFFLYIVEH